MERKHKFKIHSINKKTRAIEMTATSTTKKCPTKESWRLLKGIWKNIQSNTTIAMNLLHRGQIDRRSNGS